MIHYALEVSIAWTLFYIVYFFFLKKETFLSINRWYLLHTCWLGLLLPLLRKIPMHVEYVQPVIMEPVLMINYTTAAISETITSPDIAYDKIIYCIYFLGLLFFAYRFLHGLSKIWRLYVAGEKTKNGSYSIVVSDNFHLPFSFLNCIFLHRSFLENSNIKEILNHEIAHVKSRHTLDVLFMEVVSILFWWNPIIYIYKRELRQTHEYVAAYASQSSYTKNYGQILIGQSSSGIELALTNQFFNSYLKKRITMLYKEKSAKHKLSKYALVIPTLLFLGILYSFEMENYQNNSSEELKQVYTNEMNDNIKLLNFNSKLKETTIYNESASYIHPFKH